MCATCTPETHFKNTAGTSCILKSTKSNCVEFVSAASALTCTKCEAGFYIVSGACVATPIPDCIYEDPDMTTTKNCLICEEGKYWNTTDKACTECDGEYCVHSGCETLDYPNMPADDDDSGAAAASSIMLFLMSIFVLAITILI